MYIGELMMTLVQAVRILFEQGLIENRWLRGMEVEIPGRTWTYLVLKDASRAPSLAWDNYCDDAMSELDEAVDWDSALVENTPANFGCFLALSQEAFRNIELDVAVNTRRRVGDAPSISNREAYFEWVCMLLVVLADEALLSAPVETVPL